MGCLWGGHEIQGRPGSEVPVRRSSVSRGPWAVWSVTVYDMDPPKGSGGGRARGNGSQWMVGMGHLNLNPHACTPPPAPPSPGRRHIELRWS